MTVRNRTFWERAWAGRSSSVACERVLVDAMATLLTPIVGRGGGCQNLSKTRAIAEANVKTDKTVGCQVFRAGEQQPAVDPDRGCSYCTAAERWAIPAPRGYHLPAVAM